MDFNPKDYVPIVMAALLGAGGGGVAGKFTGSGFEAGQLMEKIEKCEDVNKIQWQKLSELRAEVGILESQVKLNETVIGMRHE